jgi:FKBP-type peptidyl-prolyl cis-trans isomerase
MFNKFEAFGIGASVLSMAVALYLVNLYTTGSLLARGSVANSNQSAVVVVSSEGDQQTELRKAIVSAANADGTVRKLIIDDVILGNGDAVQTGDTVTVHYVGTLQNGQEFDNSRKRGEPFTFTLGEAKVIQGWEEGIVGMKVGGKRILVIPSDKAYGDKGFGPIPGGATLVFAIELNKFTKAK